MITRRSLAPLLLAPVLPALIPAARAAGYPDHTVRMVVPYPPGGGTDSLARFLSAKLQDAFGQTILVDNRPGAGASIGAEIVAKSAPDGYTFLETAGAALTVNPQLLKVGYDPEKDLIPVAQLTRAVMIYCVSPKTGIKSVKDLIAYAKANPGTFNFGTAGNGTITQLSWEMLKLAAGIDLTHVPYKGSGPAINDLLGGRVQGVAESVLIPYIKAGQMTPIAVGGDKRWPELPDVPSMAELGYPDVRPSAWYGAFVPKGTPDDVVTKLSDTLIKVITAPDLADKLLGIGMVAEPRPRAEFAKLIHDDIQTNAKVIKAAHITLE
jgi:tripartite-type tricarboxylate transporter receptor subunit TctC